MAQNQEPGEQQQPAEESGIGAGLQQEDELSFYSDDSFEYVPISLSLIEKSRFKNVNNIQLSPLNFEGLPEYETTDEEEEEGQEQPEESEFHNQQAPDMMGINSPAPHNRLTNESSEKNKMNKKDY